MTSDEKQAVLSLCLMAAFADGQKHDREREQIRQVVESLGSELPPGLFQQVLLRKPTLAEVVAPLSDPAHRQLAYEWALCVCEAQGAISPAERSFLEDLRKSLRLDSDETQQVESQAQQIITAPVVVDELGTGPTVDSFRTEGGALAIPEKTCDALVKVPQNQQNAGGENPGTGQAASHSMADTQRESEIDTMVLRYAILNGALEMLPQGISTLGILPLQVKMVYRVGQRYGYKLDRGHIKDFIATLGVGATSQMFENFARKLVGGLSKKVGKGLFGTLGGLGGGMLGNVGSAATGAAFSFATTYAMGQVAKIYYRQGRNISTTDLKQLFQSWVEKGQSLFSQHRSTVEQQASTLDSKQVATLLRE